MSANVKRPSPERTPSCSAYLDLIQNIRPFDLRRMDPRSFDAHIQQQDMQRHQLSICPLMGLTEVGMTKFSDSYVLTTLLAPHAPALRPNAVVRQWRRMLDPYRPELHYMRGPGPKWREKHVCRTAH